MLSAWTVHISAAATHDYRAGRKQKWNFRLYTPLLRHPKYDSVCGLWVYVTVSYLILMTIT